MIKLAEEGPLENISNEDNLVQYAFWSTELDFYFSYYCKQKKVQTSKLLIWK
jgi:hypothetical protein